MAKVARPTQPTQATTAPAVHNGSQHHDAAATDCAVLAMLRRLRRAGVPMRVAHIGMLTLVLDNLNAAGSYTKGHDYLAKRTGEGRKAIIRLMAALVDAGYLARERRGGKESGPSSYRPLLSISTPETLVSKTTPEEALVSKTTRVDLGRALVSKSTRTDLSLSSLSVRTPRSGALSGDRGVRHAADAGAENGKSTAPAGAARTFRPKPRTTNPKVFEAMVWREFGAHPTMDPGEFKDRVRTVAAQQAIDYTLDQLAGMLDKVDARRDRQERAMRQEPRGERAVIGRRVPEAEKTRRREARRHPDRAAYNWRDDPKWAAVAQDEPGAKWRQ